ncbi:hypothetical protein N0V91_005580 [Didymella pomorum]|uniref:Uncharacterized protein n=1 Tax=Didymella pomorum TaxID=749634 RepID=A0A9W9D6I5_9PLEO|nr:hypothetical protein N0V91_005580 [Didymella pomorum]
MTPDGNNGPIRKPRTTINTTEMTGNGSTANRVSTQMAKEKYIAVALRTPTLSVNGPKTSRPTAMPAQKPEEDRPARYGVAARLRSMKDTTHPEIAVSTPTSARKYAAHHHVAGSLSIALDGAQDDGNKYGQCGLQQSTPKPYSLSPYSLPTHTNSHLVSLPQVPAPHKQPAQAQSADATTAIPQQQFAKQAQQTRSQTGRSGGG